MAHTHRRHSAATAALATCVVLAFSAFSLTADAGDWATKKRADKRRLDSFKRSQNHYHSHKSTPGGQPFTTFRWVPPAADRGPMRPPAYYNQDRDRANRNQRRRNEARAHQQAQQRANRAITRNCKMMRLIARYGVDWREMMRRTAKTPWGTYPKKYAEYSLQDRLWLFNERCKFNVLERWSIVVMWHRKLGIRPPPPPLGYRVWPEHHYNRLLPAQRNRSFLSRAELNALAARNIHIAEVYAGRPPRSGKQDPWPQLTPQPWPRLPKMMVAPPKAAPPVSRPPPPISRPPSSIGRPPRSVTHGRKASITADPDDRPGRVVVLPNQRQRIDASTRNGWLYARCWVVVRYTVRIAPTGHVHELQRRYEPCRTETLKTGGDTGKPLPGGHVLRGKSPKKRPAAVRWHPPATLPGDIVRAARTGGGASGI